MDYDLLVFGGDRIGIDRAVKAAENGLRVAMVGTVPGRDPSMELIRIALTNLLGQQSVTMASWRMEVARLAHEETLALQTEMERWGVHKLFGQARFLSQESVEISNEDGLQIVSAKRFVVACGTRSIWPASFRGNPRFVFTLESLLDLRDIPQSIVIVGAGKSGMSTAVMMSTLGVEVTVVDERVSMTDVYRMFEGSFDDVPSLNLSFRLGDEAIGAEFRPDLPVAVRLTSGRVLVADAVLVCVGRAGNTENLNLEAAGVGLDERGRIWCDANGQTWAPQITAVGDVVGFTKTPDHAKNESDCAIPNFVSQRRKLLGC